jgi:hypothetical protein
VKVRTRQQLAPPLFSICQGPCRYPALRETLPVGTKAGRDLLLVITRVAAERR